MNNSMSAVRSRSAGSAISTALQSIVEVAPQSAFSQRLLEVAVGRGDHAHIDAGCAFRSDWHDGPIFQRAQEADLESRGGSGYFVQKQRSPMRLDEFAPPAGGARSLKGAFFVPKEFRGYQLLRDRAAIEDLERSISPGTGGVNRVGKQFLACSRLSFKHHGQIGPRHAHCRLLGGLELRAPTDELAETVM